MLSFRKARDVLILANQTGTISDEEYLLLFDVNTSRNPDFPYWKKYDNFELDSMSDDDCKTKFLFLNNDVYFLAETFDVPEVIKCCNDIVDGIEAFCVLLKRFAYPCRYADMFLVSANHSSV